MVKAVVIHVLIIFVANFLTWCNASMLYLFWDWPHLFWLMILPQWPYMVLGYPIVLPQYPRVYFMLQHFHLLIFSRDKNLLQMLSPAAIVAHSITLLWLTLSRIFILLCSIVVRAVTGYHSQASTFEQFASIFTWSAPIFVSVPFYT